MKLYKNGASNCLKGWDEIKNKGGEFSHDRRP